LSSLAKFTINLSTPPKRLKITISHRCQTINEVAGHFKRNKRNQVSRSVKELHVVSQISLKCDKCIESIIKIKYTDGWNMLGDVGGFGNILKEGNKGNILGTIYET
jgi:hypothetical protein